MFKAKPSFLQRVLLIGVLCMLLECLAVAVFAIPNLLNKIFSDAVSILRPPIPAPKTGIGYLP